jgi:hypothetical protein
MGQRAQIFVITENLDLLDNSYHKPTQREKEAFGTGKTTVLAYHHQWLFGRGALKNTLRVLEYVKKSKKIYYSPFNSERRSPSLTKTVEMGNLVRNLMSIDTKRGDYNYFIPLNDSTQPKDESEDIMREKFDMGDNNDGFHIIDTINLKYCFIANNACDSTLRDGVPHYTPLSAETFVRAYYPLNAEDSMTAEEVVSYFPKMKNKMFQKNVTQTVGA